MMRRRDKNKSVLCMILTFLLTCVLLAGCVSVPAGNAENQNGQTPGTVTQESGGDAAETVQNGGQKDKEPIDRHGSYTTKEDVALYIYTYGELPENFITKKQARKLGWQGGSLEKYAPGKCIGGDWFGNNEGLLPEDEDYHECDIDTLGADSRGSKRLVYSDDHIYYTEDHYASFELIYGEK